MLSAVSCSDKAPGEVVLVNKKGEVVGNLNGSTTDDVNQNQKDELNVAVNNFFTMDKKKKERLYTFKPNAWFCAKRLATDIQKHTAGFPIDLKLDGDEYFTIVVIDTSNISLASYQKKMAIVGSSDIIYSTNATRVLSASSFTWSDIASEISNSTNFFTKINNESSVSHMANGFRINSHPMLAFLPHHGDPAMLLHLYAYNKSYEFKVENVLHATSNLYTTVFVEILPGLIYHNSALASSGVEILLSFNIYLRDFSSVILSKPTTQEFLRLANFALDGVPRNFVNSTRQRGGHEYPLPIKIVFPKHEGLTSNLSCS